jgi:hypothetical protein
MTPPADCTFLAECPGYDELPVQYGNFRTGPESNSA